eukprot:TRINITY_DN82164_c0_g1_i1.p1 TRINITY_DN82164_c0_g1~~TRINITY_DN82164_c0_g1_i1.p1  ORF type:complete len:417 (+),score=45.85 TRINITY_DN82164_c0_g1_i1:66-1253(+)
MAARSWPVAELQSCLKMESWKEYEPMKPGWATIPESEDKVGCAFVMLQKSIRQSGRDELEDHIPHKDVILSFLVRLQHDRAEYKTMIQQCVRRMSLEQTWFKTLKYWPELWTQPEDAHHASERSASVREHYQDSSSRTRSFSNTPLSEFRCVDSSQFLPFKHDARSSSRANSREPSVGLDPEGDYRQRASSRGPSRPSSRGPGSSEIRSGSSGSLLTRSNLRDGQGVHIPPLILLPQSGPYETPDAFWALDEAMQAIAAIGFDGSKGDQAMQAFDLFQRSVRWLQNGVTGDSTTALDRMEHKHDVLNFLYSFQASKRLHQKRVCGVIYLLVQLPQWRRSVIRHPELCRIVSMDVKELQASLPRSSRSSMLLKLAAFGSLVALGCTLMRMALEGTL